ncbi:MAG: rod shape-determining protein RodA, partial [Deltaproteobacteria bacterium]|nr:rod shape-determining protein RodA [Deltaproteobacteria bacterium]
MTQRISEVFNWQLLSVVLSLVVIGLVNLYSAVHLWEEGGALTLFWNQLIWMALGVAMMLVMT